MPAGETRPPQRVSAWALMLGSGPRFARDAFGPVLVFYAAWKLLGFGTAILAATTLAIAAYVWERRQARSGRPLAGVFAQETYPFPAQVKASLTFRRVFSRISLAWATYLLCRTGLRFVVLLRSSVELYLLINVVTGIPFTAALMSWSIWYGVRSFRRSQEWGPFLSDR